MNKSLRLMALMALILPHSLQANEASSAMAEIQKMSDSMHHKSYEGEFVYLHGDQIESMSIQHVRSQNGVKERLFSLNGEAREVFRDDENLTCVWPGSKKIVKDDVKQSSFSPLWIPDDVKRLSKFYQFKIVGMDRIANRSSKVLSIKPKDGMRYGMQIWVDEKEGYLLKSVLLNEHDDILEQVMFTHIESIKNPEIKAMSLIPNIKPDYRLVQAHAGTQDNRLLPDSAWKMEKLPQGFWMESSYKKPSSKNNEFVHHMIFTDGLASLSLFIETQTDESLMGSSSMGAINAYGVIINGFSVTAVGEVPQKTVKHVVSAIYHE